MSRIKSLLNRFFGIAKNKKGQGATEYILLLLVIVAIAMLFKGQIMDAVNGKLGELSGQISGFSASP